MPYSVRLELSVVQLPETPSSSRPIAIRWQCGFEGVKFKMPKSVIMGFPNDFSPSCSTIKDSRQIEKRRNRIESHSFAQFVPQFH